MSVPCVSDADEKTGAGPLGTSLDSSRELAFAAHRSPSPLRTLIIEILLVGWGSLQTPEPASPSFPLLLAARTSRMSVAVLPFAPSLPTSLLRKVLIEGEARLLSLGSKLFRMDLRCILEGAVPIPAGFPGNCHQSQRSLTRFVSASRAPAGVGLRAALARLARLLNCARASASVAGARAEQIASAWSQIL